MNFFSSIRKWTVIFRLHSIFFVVLPYLLGILVAVFSDGNSLKLAYSLVGFVPLLFNHIAANLLSDIQDYRKGIDVEPDFFSGGIVRGWLGLRQAMRTVIVLYLLSLGAGMYLFFQVGMIVLPFLALGYLLGIFYSTGNTYAFKYNVSGEWFIFFGFGMLIPAYGYLLNAGELSWMPVLISLPAAFLIAAVKHANNWIAALSPGNLEKYTAASILGFKAARVFYYLMIALPYILVPLLIQWENHGGRELPASFIIVYFTLPLLIFLFFRAGRRSVIAPFNRILGLDSLTAMLYIAFMTLSCVSVMLG